MAFLRDFRWPLTFSGVVSFQKANVSASDSVEPLVGRADHMTKVDE